MQEATELANSDRHQNFIQRISFFDEENAFPSVIDVRYVVEAETC